MEWSKGKGIVAYGPTIFGHHFVFVDDELNVAVFLPKFDGTLHVLNGTPIQAEHWRKYDSSGKEVASGTVSRYCQWKITRDSIYYRGPILPKKWRPHRGIIHNVNDFNGTVGPEFIARTACEILHHMHENGELPLSTVVKQIAKSHEFELSDTFAKLEKEDHQSEKGTPAFAIPDPNGKGIIGGGHRTSR